MPSIKKAEYEQLKKFYKFLKEDLHKMTISKTGLSLEVDILVQEIKNLKYERDRWKRLAQKLMDTYHVEEFAEMPGCLKPFDSIRYTNRE